MNNCSQFRDKKYKLDYSEEIYPLVIFFGYEPVRSIIWKKGADTFDIRVEIDKGYTITSHPFPNPINGAKFNSFNPSCIYESYCSCPNSTYNKSISDNWETRYFVKLAKSTYNKMIIATLLKKKTKKNKSRNLKSNTIIHSRQHLEISLDPKMIQYCRKHYFDTISSMIGKGGHIDFGNMDPTKISIYEYSSKTIDLVSKFINEKISEYKSDDLKSNSYDFDLNSIIQKYNKKDTRELPKPSNLKADTPEWVKPSNLKADTPEWVMKSDLERKVEKLYYNTFTATSRDFS